MDTRINYHIAVVPGRMYADARLGQTHKDILGIITLSGNVQGNHGRGGWLAISIKAIVALTGRGRSTVIKSLSDLVDHQYLDKAPQKEKSGASSVNMYRVIYDADLPAEHDRWQKHLDQDGILIVPKTPGAINPDQAVLDLFGRHASPQTDQNVSLNKAQYEGIDTDYRGSNPQDPPQETAVNRGSNPQDPPRPVQGTPPDKPQKTAIIGGPTYGTPPVQPSGPSPTKTGETMGSGLQDPPSNNCVYTYTNSLDSNRLDSNRSDQFKSSEESTADSERSPSAAAERILDKFLIARGDAFTDAPSGMSLSARKTQIIILSEILAAPGACEALVASTLVERIKHSADKNLGSPASVNRYRDDVFTAIRRADRDAQLSTEIAATREPDLPPEPDDWAEIVTTVMACLSSSEKAFLPTLAYIGRPQSNEQEVVLAVPTKLVFDALNKSENSDIPTALERLERELIKASSDTLSVKVLIDYGLCDRRRRQREQHAATNSKIAANGRYSRTTLI